LRAADCLVALVPDLVTEMFTTALFADVGVVWPFMVLLVRQVGEFVSGYIVGAYDAQLTRSLVWSGLFVNVAIVTVVFAFLAIWCGS
jgi:hypothetical protein